MCIGFTVVCVCVSFIYLFFFFVGVEKRYTTSIALFVFYVLRRYFLMILLFRTVASL